MYKVTWTPSSLNVLKFTTNAEIDDSRYSIEERLITCEDETIGLFTHSAYLPRDSPAFKSLAQAMLEIY